MLLNREKRMQNNLNFLSDECWFGGNVIDGVHQPYTAKSACVLDLSTNHTPNQTMPLLLSTKGRWLWNPNGMRVQFEYGKLYYTSGTQSGQSGNTLRSAYFDAMTRFFPFSAGGPAQLFLDAPVYNTWIELTFHQAQDAVLRYAEAVLSNGFPSGVLMIDDGWNDYYGKWKFSVEKFPDPSSMLNRLKELGFHVMLWICPFITPDTVEYRELEQKGLLVQTASGETHIAHWWNGYSAVLDMTKPDTIAWLKKQLDTLVALGVSGFKFDAGDSIYYPSNGTVSPDEHSRAWAKFGAQYVYNEFRVTAGAGGWPLMQRLCDKDHSWDEHGLAALIPDAIVQSLTGHPFLCPDMIGGGEYQNFYAQGQLDSMLFVRWAQIACLMPVMQFSAAPWRVLEEKELAQVKESVALRQKWMSVLREAWMDCVRTGEPILRPMVYCFPQDDCAAYTDQFMIGNTLLVAPILRKGATARMVYLPKGEWQFENKRIRSEGMRVQVTINEHKCPFVFQRIHEDFSSSISNLA